MGEEDAGAESGQEREEAATAPRKRPSSPPQEEVEGPSYFQALSQRQEPQSLTQMDETEDEPVVPTSQAKPKKRRLKSKKTAAIPEPEVSDDEI